MLAWEKRLAEIEKKHGSKKRTMGKPSKASSASVDKKKEQGKYDR